MFDLMNSFDFSELGLRSLGCHQNCAFSYLLWIKNTMFLPKAYDLTVTSYNIYYVFMELYKKYILQKSILYLCPSGAIFLNIVT